MNKNNIMVHQEPLILLAKRHDRVVLELQRQTRAHRNAEDALANSRAAQRASELTTEQLKHELNQLRLDVELNVLECKEKVSHAQQRTLIAEEKTERAQRGALQAIEAMSFLITPRSVTQRDRQLLNYLAAHARSTGAFALLVAVQERLAEIATSTEEGANLLFDNADLLLEQLSDGRAAVATLLKVLELAPATTPLAWTRVEKVFDLLASTGAGERAITQHAIWLFSMVKDNKQSAIQILIRTAARLALTSPSQARDLYGRASRIDRDLSEKLLLELLPVTRSLLPAVFSHPPRWTAWALVVLAVTLGVIFLWWLI